MSLSTDKHERLHTTMSKKITPYQNSKLGKKEQVTRMFDAISKHYDGLNRVITFGIDVRWRKKVLQLVGKKEPKRILDIATGTGDLAIMMAELQPEKITGLDISPGMLEIGRQKIDSKRLSSNIEMVLGDAENIPFEDNYFEAITVSFGVRNFENLEKGLKEILRVLKPGGIFVVLETAVPTKTPFKQGYKWHSTYVLPLVGKLFSKDKAAYDYLSKSANAFPHGAAFTAILDRCGFSDSKAIPVTFGVASIYTASKEKTDNK